MTGLRSERRSGPHLLQLEKALTQQEDPAQPHKKKKTPEIKKQKPGGGAKMAEE